MNLLELATLPLRTISRAAELEEKLREVLGAVPAMAEDLRRVRATIEPQHDSVEQIDERVGRMERDLGGLAETLNRLERLAVDLAEHVPDPDAPGPIARARDALSPT